MSPTARALLALEVIQNAPGITAQRLGERLGVTDRAARRYVAILREADLPIESVSGCYGGYRVGSGLRLPPLMFTPAEGMGLVMAVMEGHRDAANPVDLVGGALAKIIAVLSPRIARPIRAFRDVTPPRPTDETLARPELITELIEACTAARQLRLLYRRGAAASRVMEIAPWAVVLRHSRWYLLGWSPARQAMRILRVDRIVTIESWLAEFEPPPDLDALGALEAHLSEGWTYPVEVLIDATIEETARWVPRNLGRLEPAGQGRTCLRATTDEPDWYARRLAAIPAPFRVIGSPEMQWATAALGRRLLHAAGSESAST